MAFGVISLQNTIQEVTRRIVDIARPQRIVLFGSAAQSKMTADSDLDILVIMRGPVHRRARWRRKSTATCTASICRWMWSS